MTKPRYDPQRHHRRSIRLKEYDYTQAGAYFVTICTQHRKCLFGKIECGEMALNEAGRMVQTEWQQLEQRFPTVALDAYVAMPNHLHGIIVIIDPNTPVGATPVVAPSRPSDPNTPVGATLVVAPSPGAGTSPAPTDIRPALGDIVGAFKFITTNAYIRGVRERGWPPFDKRVWQRNYYERVIRNRQGLNATRQYINHNPAQWHIDRENPNQQT